MNCVEFWVKEVFKCRERRMMPYDEEWTKAQPWGCPLDTPKNIQEVQASKLGDAQGIPSSSIKSTRSFFNALYFYCFMHYVLFLKHLYFFSVFILFVCLINLDPSCFVLEIDTLLNSYIEHSSFHFNCFLVF